MVFTAHLGHGHVKFRKIREDLGFNWRLGVSNWRSGDDLKKLENLSSRREVHMYGIWLFVDFLLSLFIHYTACHLVVKQGIVHMHIISLLQC